jgi:GDPmannose 4,6-dehydratase
MFGCTHSEYQNEITPFNPISPYAVAKTMAHKMAQIYRREGLFISCGISFNHESPRRGDQFLTRKVVKAVAAKTPIQLGNLNAVRDWGYAPEHTEAMMRILSYKCPEDFVIGTGIGNSVQDFVEMAYESAGLNWLNYVTIDQSLYRPIEAGPLIANYSKAQRLLGWSPSTNFEQLIQLMVDYEIKSNR